MDVAPIVPKPLDPSAGAAARAATRAEARAHQAAEAFEAGFLAEMLKHSGVNAMPSGFGGGAGEEAFASFLTQEYARQIAARGGVGLAEQVFELLKQRTSVP